MNEWFWLIVFVGVELWGVAIAISWFHDRGVVIPKQDPRYIFRLVRREDRAAYQRIMRRTMAVAMRDFSRALNQTARVIGKALLPSLQRVADAFAAAFGEKS